MSGGALGALLVGIALGVLVTMIGCYVWLRRRRQKPHGVEIEEGVGEGNQDRGGSIKNRESDWESENRLEIGETQEEAQAGVEREQRSHFKNPAFTTQDPGEDTQEGEGAAYSAWNRTFKIDTSSTNGSPPVSP